MNRKDKQPAPAAVTAFSEVLTVSEVAGLLKVPQSSIYEWTRYRGSNRNAPLPHRKIGKYLRFLRVEVDEWLRTLPVSQPKHKRKYTRQTQDAA
jgi:excisionase family DNA binding protein